MALALGLIRIGIAGAFPLIDPTNQDQVPQGTELATPDAQDLRHQLQMVNGLAAPAGGGWTFVPRIDWQEMLTDNVQEQHSPRQADLVSYFSPGFTLIGDLPRVRMVLSYAPVVSIYARTSSQDALTQQLYGLGTVTLVPELAYVDVRALSGVQSVYGGLGGLGTNGYGAGSYGAGTTGQAAIPTVGGNAGGLTRDNEVQTTTFGISPYLLHSFGDWGTGKVGYSLDVTRSNRLTGFAPPPFPTGGPNGQTLVTNEVMAHYSTGEVMQFLRNSIDLDAQHGQITADASGSGATRTSSSASTSDRVIISDTVSYVLTPSFLVFVSGGHEDITYSNQNAQPVAGSTVLFGVNGGQLPPIINFTNSGAPPVHDLTWSLGATWTPDPDSGVTLSYGHSNGFNAFSAYGHYQATARTQFTVSYGSTRGTQLENLQNEFNLAGTNGRGTLVNGQTGGTLFGSTNALAVQNGVFRTDTLTIGSLTALERDIISLNLLFTKQTSLSGNGSSAASRGINGSWLHEMRPDMQVSAGFSFAVQTQTQTLGAANAISPGNNTSLAATLAWQYQVSDTVDVSLRYSFLERQSSATVYSFYQNMLILGVSKTF